MSIISRNEESLFPIPVALVQLGVDIQAIRRHAESIEYIDNAASEDADNWQSASLDVLGTMPELKQILVDEVHMYKDRLLGCFSTDFAVTTSWLTKTGHGGSCQWHRHSNSWISGCLYLDGGDGWAPFQLQSPTPDYGILVNPDFDNMYNGKVMNYKPAPGLLILFPSHMLHRIGPHKGAEDRYSLAFNCFPVGHIGNMDSSMTVSVGTPSPTKRPSLWARAGR